MATLDGFPTKFPDMPNYTDDHRFMLLWAVKIIRNIMQGRTNNVHTVTLNANATTTAVDLPVDTLGQYSAIFFMPTTASAATEFGAGSMYVSARAPLSTTATFTITHTNTADTDKTFYYIIVG